MPKQRQDLKDGDLFITLKSEEPARILYADGKKAFRVSGVKGGTVFAFGGFVEVPPEEPVLLIDRQSLTNLFVS